MAETILLRQRRRWTRLFANFGVSVACCTVVLLLSYLLDIRQPMRLSMDTAPWPTVQYLYQGERPNATVEHLPRHSIGLPPPLLPVSEKKTLIDVPGGQSPDQDVKHVSLPPSVSPLPLLEPSHATPFPLAAPTRAAHGGRPDEGITESAGSGARKGAEPGTLVEARRRSEDRSHPPTLPSIKASSVSSPGAGQGTLQTTGNETSATQNHTSATENDASAQNKTSATEKKTSATQTKTTGTQIKTSATQNKTSVTPSSNTSSSAVKMAWTVKVGGRPSSPVNLQAGTSSAAMTTAAVSRRSERPPPPPQKRTVLRGCPLVPTSSSNILLWDPGPSETRKYIVPMCWFGQTSNRVRCMLNHFMLAALLNRTIIIPPDLPRKYAGRERSSMHLWLDLDTVHACFGPNVAVTVDDFLQTEVEAAKKQGQVQGGIHIHVDHVQCLAAPARGCMDDQLSLGCPLSPESMLLSLSPEENTAANGTRPALHLISLAQHLNLSLDLSRATWDTPCLTQASQLSDVLMSFQDHHSLAFWARVLVIGDLMKLSMQDNTSAYMKPLTSNAWPLPTDPFVRKAGCPHRGLFLPPKTLISESKRVAHQLFGGDAFAAYHWRQGDHVQVCKKFKAHCGRNASEAGPDLGNILRMAKVSRLFLATDASLNEADLLANIANQTLGGTLVVKTLNLSIHQMLELSKVLHVGEDQFFLIAIMMDKLICTQSSVFIGSTYSTFSHDIFRMRKDLNTLTNCDTWI